MAMEKNPTMIRVDLPKDPPKEVLNQEFSSLPSMDDGDGGQATPPPVEEKAPIEEKTTETEFTTDETAVPRQSPSVKKEEPKQEITPKVEKEEPRYLRPPKGKDGQLLPRPKDDFDPKGFSPQEASILKQMPRENRAYVVDLIAKAKEVEKLKTGTYLQDPNAWQIHPDVQVAQRDSFMANREAKVWAEQLSQCKLGKNVKQLTGFDEAGNPVYGAELQASDALEEQLRQNMNQCLGVAEKRKGDLNTLKNNFSNIAKQDLQVIQQERANRFEWVKDPKVLDYVVQTEDGDKTVKQIRTDVINLFPAYMHNNIGIQTLADVMVALGMARAEINDLKNNNKVTETKLEESRRVEPSSDARRAMKGEKVNGISEFNMSGAGVEI